MLAQLVDEPFAVQPGALEKLTLREIARIYFWPRNKEGVLKPPQYDGEDRGQSHADVFRGVWRVRGATEEQIDKLWAATVDHERAKRERAVREGIASMDGTVADGLRWVALEAEYEAEWERIAKRILGHE